ncbi:hypothetical protein [Paenibacillus sp. RC343]|uniref:hypothetical protein n=1 Tax=Paenibacillus sp. RC343 TaxID=3045841 RepID=UPI0024BA8C80|nr:hypothetical protein [Paenibacillus sp. RC343]
MEDLILRSLLPPDFFSIRFLWGKSGGKGERYRFSRFKSSTPLLHSHKDEFALGEKLGR